ncbi:restriction endonuclease subunit S [Streptomyces sp. 16-176A]|uniref:restriction endonuclease subunit S n=1 Tax=Streptomyces sp. 16-176A TaxID=2530458 RepID=UPI00345D5C4F
MSFASVPLGEIAEINPLHREAVDPETEVSFLGMADVSELGTTTSGENRVYGEVRTGYTPFRTGDVLVAKITPCFQNGKIAQAQLEREIGAGSTEFHVVRASKEVNARYLLRFLRQDWIRVEGELRMTGSGGQRRVPEAYLRELMIPLPPITKQKQIAAVLDQVDTLRAKRREAIALLDNLTQSIFLDMFGDPVSNDRGWERVRMGDLLASIESGKSPQCLDRQAADGEWGVLKLGAVTQRVYLQDENKALPSGVVPDARHEVRAGDLLFTRKNTPNLVAASAYVRSTRSRLLMPDLIFRLVVADNAPVDKVYLHALLTQAGKRRKLQKLASGSAASMVNISKSKLLEFVCEVPPLALQRKFAQLIEAVEAQRDVHRNHLATLDELFTSLQHRAFSGTLWDHETTGEAA